MQLSMIDCYFYMEIQDMNAKVPSCDYYRNMGFCPCSKDCSKYISKSAVKEEMRQRLTDDKTSLNRNCAECIYGLYETNNQETRVCHGFDEPLVDAVKRIHKSGPCEKFEEGHRLFIEYIKSGDSFGRFKMHIPPEKRYEYDPRNYIEGSTSYCQQKYCSDKSSDGRCHRRHHCAYKRG